MFMNIRKLQSLLKGITGGSRLEILRFLKRRRGSASVSMIAEGIDRSVQTTSGHLILLTLHGVVQRRQRGRDVFYRLSMVQQQPVKNILSLL